MGLNGSGVDLAFDTSTFRSGASVFKEIGDSISQNATQLDNLLIELKETGWTTGAGSAFQLMVSTSWKQEMDKYSDYMYELESILIQVSDMYENLEDNYISKISI